MAPFSVFRDCPDCPEMVVIPSGTFEMGSTYAERQAEIELDESLGIDLHQIRDTSVVPDDMFDEEPKHTVHIGRSFAIGKYVITKAQFEQYIRETGVEINSCSILAEGDFVVVDSVNWQTPFFATSDLHPVVCVSWRDVKGYLQWLSDMTGHTYRLPSEAEWEYVAKAGTTTRRFFGNDRDAICDYGNVLDLTFRDDRMRGGGSPIHRQIVYFNCYDGHANIAPVQRDGIAPNPWGVYEMMGNVFEMVQDKLHLSYEGAPTDGSAWEEGGLKYRVGRGGAYNTMAAFATPTYRGYLEEDFRLIYLGFRVVREL